MDTLNNIGVSSMNESVIPVTEETLAMTFELGLQGKNIGIKIFFFRIMEMAPMDMIHRKTLDTIQMKSFDHLSHSGAFVNAKIEEMHRHPALTQDPAKHFRPKTKSKSEEGMKKKYDELTGSLTSKTEPLTKKSNDSSLARAVFAAATKKRRKIPASTMAGNRSVYCHFPHH